MSTFLSDHCLLSVLVRIGLYERPELMLMTIQEKLSLTIQLDNNLSNITVRIDILLDTPLT